MITVLELELYLIRGIDLKDFSITHITDYHYFSVLQDYQDYQKKIFNVNQLQLASTKTLGYVNLICYHNGSQALWCRMF